MVNRLLVAPNENCRDPTAQQLQTINWSDRYVRLQQQSQPREAVSKPANLPLEAYRVLDAPGLVDDFYLNVLDWGRRDLLAVALGPTVYLWNGQSESVSQLPLLEETAAANEGETAQVVAALRWIHDGTSLAVSRGRTVQLWDAARGKRLRTLVHGAERAAALAWNRALLSLGLRDGSLQTHDVRQARSLVSQQTGLHAGEVCGLAWSIDGRRLAAGGADQQVSVIEQANGALTTLRRPLQSAVKALAWCPWQSGLLALGGGRQDPRICLYDANNPTATTSPLPAIDTGAQVSSLCWSMHARELVSTHGYPRAQLAKYRLLPNGTLSLLGELEAAHQGHRLLHSALSPDGQSLVTAGADETLRFWRNVFTPPPRLPATGKQTRRLVMMPMQAGSKAAVNLASNHGGGLPSPYTQLTTSAAAVAGPQ